VDAVGNNNSTQASPPNPDDFKNDKKNDNESTKNKDLKKDNSNVPKPKDFNDPTKSPGEGWEWKGGEKGAWHNKQTKQSLRPALNDTKHGPHWDYKGKEGNARIYPDNKVEWKDKINE